MKIICSSKLALEVLNGLLSNENESLDAEVSMYWNEHGMLLDDEHELGGTVQTGEMVSQIDTYKFRKLVVVLEQLVEQPIVLDFENEDIGIKAVL